MLASNDKAGGLPLDALALAVTVGLVGFATGLYQPETCVANRRLLRRAATSAALLLPAVWLVAAAGRIDVAHVLRSGLAWPLATLLGWFLLVLSSRLLFSAARRTDLFVRRVAVLGAGPAAARTVAAIAGMRRGLFRVEANAALAPPAAPARGQRLPPRLWAVVGAGPQDLAGISARIRRFDIPTFWENQLGRVDVDRGEGPDRPDTPPDTPPPSSHRVAAVVRRGMDITLAAALLLLTAPVMLATAALIRLESRGPILYRQERVGLGGGCFTLWKFRSMRQDAERLGPTWAALHDQRVTAVGRLIRQLRIDELPQLVNILRGDMGMVGPRPERPHFVAQLAAAIPLYGERTRVKPGLTGWAQVNYPYGASVEDARAKLSYDLYYLKHRSLLLDLMILLATVRVILFQEGAR